MVVIVYRHKFHSYEVHTNYKTPTSQEDCWKLKSDNKHYMYMQCAIYAALREFHAMQ